MSTITERREKWVALMREKPELIKRNHMFHFNHEDELVGCCAWGFAGLVYAEEQGLPIDTKLRIKTGYRWPKPELREFMGVSPLAATMLTSFNDAPHKWHQDDVPIYPTVGAIIQYMEENTFLGDTDG